MLSYFLMQERQLVLESTVVLSETGGNRMLEFACYYCVRIYDKKFGEKLLKNMISFHPLSRDKNECITKHC